MKEELIQFSYEKLLPSVDLQALKLDVDLLEVRRFFAKCTPIRGLMRYYDEHDIENGVVEISGKQLRFGGASVSCDVLKEFSTCKVKSAFVYLITCHPDSFRRYEIGEMNYHFIQNACIDLAREMILKNCRLYTNNGEDAKESIWTTKAFGPGYYGMPIEEGRTLHKLLDGERIGVSYQGSMMTPLKSSIGFAFSYEAKEQVMVNACDYCQAAVKECNYCGGRT